MKEVRQHSAAIRHDEVTCPECGHQFEAGEDS
jgi:DNA-directed RNA polymerase subunit RPC12/RpoP